MTAPSPRLRPVEGGLTFQGRVDGDVRKAVLTARQEELLLHCYARGYYEIPRRSTLRSLAKGLGISSASLSLVLRRAEAKVVEVFASSRPK